jgi:hypothetical protein
MMEMEEPDCPRYNFRTKTPISFELIAQIDALYDGGLTKWKTRYWPLVIRQRKNIEFLHIAATLLFETARLGHGDALNILEEVIRCTSANQCHQILCPACRDKRQKDTATKAIAAFSNYTDKDIKFMTLLIQVEQDANELPPLMSAFRNDFVQRLRNNAKALGTQALPFKMMGAFEIDLKNMATQWDASLTSRDLIKQLGYDRKIFKPQYLLHLHAIVGPLNGERKDHLRSLIEKSLGQQLLPYQLDIRSLHRNKPKDDNLRNLAFYMFKARLQFADNIFDDNLMQKQTRYHTPYKGNVLVDYLNVVNDMQNFKGLKFDFGA